MPDTKHETSRGLLGELWGALGGEPGWLDRVDFTGSGSLPSPFVITDLAEAVFGLVGAALSELLAVGGAVPPGVRVDRVMSSGWFYLPPGPSQLLLGAPPAAFRMPPWMTEFETADGRWLRVQASFPSLRRRITDTLAVEETPEAVARVVKQHKADDIEQLLVEAGAAVAASRTIEEWLAHPAGIAAAADPIAGIQVTSATARSWLPTPGRPLAGIKVLDMTRVAAGPFGTRFLAACGAEVLRIDAPGSDESAGEFGRGNDLTLGKRWAFLDLRTLEGMEQFRRLLSEADIFVHGYRPGGIDRLISPEQRREVKPDLIEVALRAYGWRGPWQMRRGFDTLVQWSSGIANATQAWALADPGNRVPLTAIGRPVDASRPRHLPVEALDIGTGYQLAAAAIRGLTRRLTTGAGSLTRMSMARTAALLIGYGQVPLTGPLIDLPLEGPWEDRIYSSPRGPVRRLAFPLEIEGNPLFWERGVEAVGSSSPIWSS